jgi:hypothetical protein
VEYPALKGPQHPRDYRIVLVIAFLVAIAVNGTVIGWAFWLAAQQPKVMLSEGVIDGSAAICPGEGLDYRLTMDVSKATPVNLYVSIDGPKKINDVVFSNFQQLNFDRPIHLEITRHWVMPPSYIDPATGWDTVWWPGDYTQRVTASIPGRQLSSALSMPFRVRFNCSRGDAQR